MTITYAFESAYNADVDVLAVNLAGREQFNQLDIANWRFAVLSRVALEATGQSTLTWARAQQLATAVVGYNDLAAAVREAGSG